MKNDLPISYESYESYLPSDMIPFDEIYGEMYPDPEAADSEHNFKAHLISVENKDGLYTKPSTDWILSLAAECLRHGMQKKVCTEYVQQFLVKHPANQIDGFDLTRFVFEPINKAYLYYRDDFNIENERQKITENTPFLSNSIFDTLHPYLTEIPKKLTGRELDLVFLGQLVSLSVCLPNVIGLYDGKSMNQISSCL